MSETYNVTYLIIGGGIAGVSCAETLAICNPEEKTLLLTESSVIKTVSNLEPVARYLFKFDVKERSLLPEGTDSDGSGLAPNIQTIIDKLSRIEYEAKCATTHGKRIINYKYLCLCTGGRPRLIEEHNPRIIGIRDTDSVLELQQRLKNSKSIILVGNGGIASELAYELKNVEVHWVVKDNHISSTFVDAGAAQFFLESRKNTSDKEIQNDKFKSPTTGVIKRLRYDELTPHDKTLAGVFKQGPALGPDWHRSFNLTGGIISNENKTLPSIHYKVNITNIKELQNNESESGDGLEVTLSNDEKIICDFIVSATGVYPNINFECDKELILASDGGIAVNEMMETNLANIYAAGDVCTATWNLAEHWFQMRLWTQARQMGAMAGRSMAAALSGEKIHQDFCFELFGHVTQLFGFPVVLLGRFNGQGLGTDYELLLRSTPGKEYIKFVIQKGKLRGAILIGNTELAETCENLILNCIDLTPYGDDILNPNIDIEDYFD